jgi:ABC-2 type transport system permease protein
MNQTLTIASKEFRTVFRNRLFTTIAVLFLAISVLSVYIGSATKRAELRAYDETLVTLQQQGATHLPPRPEVGTVTILADLGEFVSTVGAIPAVILGFHLVTREKESGSLPLILSRPVFRDQLLLGKLLGTSAVIGALLALVFVFDLTLVGLVGHVVPTSREVLQLLGFIVLSFFYMAIFLTFSAMLNTRITNSTTVFLVSLVVWMIFSVVIPQMAEVLQSNSTVVNSVSGVANSLPQETVASRIANSLSPAWHFRTMASVLLQASPDSGSAQSGSLFMEWLRTFLVILLPSIVFTVTGYVSFLRDELLRWSSRLWSFEGYSQHLATKYDPPGQFRPGLPHHSLLRF